ncbi:MAG: DNA polymerase III subunit beta [Deltaproteobacteria bacterium]|nr:DNA polymerase III subunit beta [Deltaproteobacteria bacterium]
MKLTINREVFLEALQRVQGIVERKHTMPILAHILLRASPEGLELSATDLEVGLRLQYPAEVSEPGGVTLQAKKAYEIARELPERGRIGLTGRENNWVELSCGRARFRVVGLPAEEFPELPVVEGAEPFEMTAGVMAGMIEKTIFAVSTDETRYNLSGVFVESFAEKGKGVLRMVATDGHRLCLVDEEIEAKQAKRVGKGVILPRKGLLELRKMIEEGLDTVSLGLKGNSAVIRGERGVVVMRLVEGEFPDYRQVIPETAGRKVLMKREEITAGLRRVSIIANEKTRPVKLMVSAGTLVLSASHPDLGEAVEEMEVQFEGEPIEVGFNARYFLDVLNVLTGEEVELGLGDEASPAVLRAVGDEGYLAIIMPMRF